MSAPDRIWLQWWGEGEPEESTPTPSLGSDEVTWCADKIFDHDIEYIRAPAWVSVEDFDGEPDTYWCEAEFEAFDTWKELCCATYDGKDWYVIHEYFGTVVRVFTMPLPSPPTTDAEKI